MYIDLFTVAKMLKYNLLRLTNNKHKTPVPVYRLRV